MSCESALKDLLIFVTSGRRYEARNPYLIPEVLSALKALDIEPRDWPGNGPPPMGRQDVPQRTTILVKIRPDACGTTVRTLDGVELEIEAVLVFFELSSGEWVSSGLFVEIIKEVSDE